jgi:hypothetical protein
MPCGSTTSFSVPRPRRRDERSAGAEFEDDDEPDAPAALPAVATDFFATLSELTALRLAASSALAAGAPPPRGAAAAALGVTEAGVAQMIVGAVDTSAHSTVAPVAAPAVA